MKHKDGGTHWNRIQKPYEEHSIKKENLSRIFADRILAYVVCYLLSQTVFHEIYLFEWTAAHYYLCVWVASVTFCFLEMYKAALITTAGNWAGILIGQVLGDFIIKINATKITPDMYIGKVWQLKTHYGVLIWLLVFLLSFIIGMLVEKKKRG